ncbi:hypothetical protein NDGK_01848 [Clostridiales bacterium CHKCI001]|nr:hypothetical protein NDGK_01848 [Clostridiales bacterium CHKCI001]
MKKVYGEPKLEKINFNVEDNLMSIQPYNAGGDAGGWGDGSTPTADESLAE